MPNPLHSWEERQRFLHDDLRYFSVLELEVEESRALSELALPERAATARAWWTGRLKAVRAEQRRRRW